MFSAQCVFKASCGTYQVLPTEKDFDAHFTPISLLVKLILMTTAMHVAA